MISKILLGLIMANGIIAIPHVFRIWVATAKTLEHNTVVLITTAGAGYLIIRYPNAYNLVKRLNYLQSKTRSELSQSELLEAEQIGGGLDRVWEMIKAAIFFNGVIFLYYGLDMVGIR
jgi:hypothetical protein